MAFGGEPLVKLQVAKRYIPENRLQEKTRVCSGKILIATVCNNFDTSIQYVQDHYFHYDAKRVTDTLATGRGQLKGATGTDWMRDPYVQDS